MSWDSGTWDADFWDHPAPPLSNYFRSKPKHKPNTQMKRQDYYPSRIAEQVLWLANYFAKITIHGPTCDVDAGDVTATVNDAKWCHYVLGLWLTLSAVSSLLLCALFVTWRFVA